MSIILILTLIVLTACSGSPVDNPVSHAAVTIQHTASQTPIPFITTPPVRTITPSLDAAVPPDIHPPPVAEIPGCRKPVDDYTLTHANGYLINQRTLEMLKYAQILYGGTINLAGDAITQGSFTDSVSASFGTHLGGGTVDLSVMYPGTYTVAYEEIPLMIKALRTAGFAAWLRDFNELSPGSPIHIHAVAIGDRQLSPAAFDQLYGKFGYFNGFNGIPQSNGPPSPDQQGPVILCEWMVEYIYQNMEPTSMP